MPLHKYYDTVNGDVYNALTPTEWQGAEGATLRSQGWTYCGFGTGGTYIAPPGGPCSTKTQPPINIGPTVPQQPAGGGGSSVPVVTDTCTSCRKSTTTVAPIQNLGSTQQTTKVIVKKSGLPWWVILLAILLAAKVVGDE